MNSAKALLPKRQDCLCESLENELSILKKQIAELAVEVQHKTEKADRYKKKYKEMKEKYRQSKMKKNEDTNADLIRIGDSLSIDKCKLALCRTSNYSKYTCDILDVVFGRTNLANSVVKGIKGSTKTVLNQNYVSDIQGHVSEKFGVNVALVRATIRNKLNSASKAAKNEIQ